jgi:hypothetical protein
LQTQAVSESGEVIEDSDDMRHLEAAFVVESQVSKIFPVLLDDPGWCLRQLIGELSERPIALGQAVGCTPVACLDRFDQLVPAALDTQKLCVRLSSVETVLAGGRNGGDELAFATGEGTRSEHDLPEELPERRADARVRHQETAHHRHESEIVGPTRRTFFHGLLRGRHVYPSLTSHVESPLVDGQGRYASAPDFSMKFWVDS